MYDEYNLSKAKDDPYIRKADKRAKGKGVYNRVKEYVNIGRKILNSYNDPTVVLGNLKGGKVLWEIQNIENNSNI